MRGATFRYPPRFIRAKKNVCFTFLENSVDHFKKATLKEKIRAEYTGAC
jgi:hypothetical protein